jgi:hypothetical protein
MMFESSTIIIRSGGLLAGALAAIDRYLFRRPRPGRGLGRQHDPEARELARRGRNRDLSAECADPFRYEVEADTPPRILVIGVVRREPGAEDQRERRTIVERRRFLGTHSAAFDRDLADAARDQTGAVVLEQHLEAIAAHAADELDRAGLGLALARARRPVLDAMHDGVAHELDRDAAHGAGSAAATSNPA